MATNALWSGVIACAAVTDGAMANGGGTEDVLAPNRDDEREHVGQLLEDRHETKERWRIALMLANQYALQCDAGTSACILASAYARQQGDNALPAPPEPTSRSRSRGNSAVPPPPIFKRPSMPSAPAPPSMPSASAPPSLPSAPLPPPVNEAPAATGLRRRIKLEPPHTADATRSLPRLRRAKLDPPRPVAPVPAPLRRKRARLAPLAGVRVKLEPPHNDAP